MRVLLQRVSRATVSVDGEAISSIGIGYVLLVGVGSAVICSLAALLLALMAGFFRGWTDSVLSRIMDLVWAFPVYLLAISLSTVLLTTPGGVKFGPITLNPSSLWMPTLIIALVYIPYVFRPVRGQVLSVREKEYVEAGVSQGASNLRLMFSDILPNVAVTVIVLLPLMIATTVLTESALSFLSIGVQPPNASWGTIIQDGQELLYTRPMVALAPGMGENFFFVFSALAASRSVGNGREESPNWAGHGGR